jgi:hypothetical protein
VACPPGSGIVDLGGMSTPNASAAHVGATACATGDAAVRIGADARPAGAPGDAGAPVFARADAAWAGCAAVVDRTRLILGAVLGSVLGAGCLAVTALLALRARRAAAAAAKAAKAAAALEAIRVIRASPDASAAGSSRSSETAAAAAAAAAMVVVRRQDVVLGECIGQGGFAAVHAARWNGTAIAAKVFKKGYLVARAGSSSGSGGGGGGATSHAAWGLRAFDSFFDSMRGGGSDSGSSVPPDAAFAREMQLLATLRHPNVCAVYGVVLAKPSPWLLMELCAGGSLHALLKRSTLDSLGWRARHAIGCGIACGVDFLHAQSPPVIHRDLKSVNVVLDSALVPKARACARCALLRFVAVMRVAR